MSNFQVIKRPPKPAYQMRIVRERVRDGMRPIAEIHIQRRNAVVSGFKNKPKFDYNIRIGDKIGIELKILLKNPDQALTSGKGKIRDLVQWLFKTGTRPHNIIPKRSKFLRFLWGGPGSYDRKVKIGGAIGTGAIRNGVLVFSKRVRHPGFARSKAMENINKQLGLKLNQVIKDSFISGLTKAKNG